MNIEHSPEGQAMERATPVMSRTEERPEHLVPETIPDRPSPLRFTNIAKRRSTEVEDVDDDGRSDDSESEDEDLEEDDSETGYQDREVASESRPTKSLPGRAADSKGAQYVPYRTRLKMKERFAQDPHAAPNKKRRFKGPPTPPLPKGARRLIQDLHTLASGNTSGELILSTLQGLFIEHNLTVENPEGGNPTGPSALPPLIPELRHEDDDMSGDSQGLSDKADYDNDTFEDGEELGHSTDVLTEYMSMANADTDYYSADADVPMDASGADVGPSHTYNADQLSVSIEGEWDVEDDQSHIPTTEDIEGSSSLQPRSDLSTVEISHGNPEGMASSKDHCNPGTTSSESGSSGSDGADADAVERQLLDPLSLQVGGAEEDTQGIPIVADTAHQRGPHVPFVATSMLQNLPMDSMVPTSERPSIETQRSTVSPFIPGEKDDDHAEQAVGPSSTQEDAFATGSQDDSGSKMEIDDVGHWKTAQTPLISDEDSRDLTFRGRAQGGHLGGNDSTFSPQTDNEVAGALEFHTTGIHSSLQFSASQLSEFSPPPTSSGSSGALSNYSGYRRDFGSPWSPYTQQPDISPPASPSDLQSDGRRSSSVAPHSEHVPPPISSTAREAVAAHGATSRKDRSTSSPVAPPPQRRDGRRSSSSAAPHSEPVPPPSLSPAAPPPKPSTLSAPTTSGAGASASSGSRRDGRRSSSSAAPHPQPIPPPISSTAREAVAAHGATSRKDRSASSPVAPPPQRRDGRRSSSSAAPHSEPVPPPSLSPAAPLLKRSTLPTPSPLVVALATDSLSSRKDRRASSDAAQPPQSSKFFMPGGREGFTPSARLTAGIFSSTHDREETAQSNQSSGTGWLSKFTNTLGLSSAPAISQRGFDMSVVQTRGESSRMPTPQLRPQHLELPDGAVKSVTPSSGRGAKVLATPLPEPLPLSAKTTYRGSLPPPTDRNPGSQIRRSPLNDQRPAIQPLSTSFGTSKFDFTMESSAVQAPFGQPPARDVMQLPSTNLLTPFSTFHGSGLRSTSESPYSRSKFLWARESRSNPYSIPGGLISDDNENESPAHPSVRPRVSPEANHTDDISPADRKGKGRELSYESTARDHSSNPFVPRAPMYGDDKLKERAGSKSGVRYGLTSNLGSDSSSDSSSELVTETRVNAAKAKSEESDGVIRPPPPRVGHSQTSKSPVTFHGSRHRQASLADDDNGDTPRQTRPAGDARRPTATNLDDDDDDDDDDIPITRRDFNRAIEVLDGVSHEVRNITQILAKSQAGPSGTKAGISGYDADSEDDKRTKPTKHRSDSQNQLAEDVAAHALTLLKRKYADSPFPRNSIASQKQVKAFKPEKGECCTGDNFALDIGGTAGSQWNDSATRVFVEDFLGANYECKNRKKITKMFKAHFRTIQRHYDKMLGPPKSPDDAPTSEQKERSRYQRKYTMFQRRHKICTRWPAMKKHIHVLEQIGTEGMSSDEEDSDGDYAVFKRVWRAKPVTTFLRILDALHRMVHTRNGRGSQSGAKRRRRYLVNNESTSPPPRKLPSNMYASDWLETLGKIELQELWPQSEYDITIDEDIVNEVRAFREMRDKHGTVWV